MNEIIADNSSQSQTLRPEHILVEVEALVERRPVSSILQSAAVRSSIERSLRDAFSWLSHTGDSLRPVQSGARFPRRHPIRTDDQTTSRETSSRPSTSQTDQGLCNFYLRQHCYCCCCCMFNHVCDMHMKCIARGMWQTRVMHVKDVWHAINYANHISYVYFYEGLALIFRIYNVFLLAFFVVVRITVAIKAGSVALSLKPPGKTWWLWIWVRSLVGT